MYGSQDLRPPATLPYLKHLLVLSSPSSHRLPSCIVVKMRTGEPGINKGNGTHTTPLRIKVRGDVFTAVSSRGGRPFRFFASWHYLGSVKIFEKRFYFWQEVVLDFSYRPSQNAIAVCCRYVSGLDTHLLYVYVSTKRRRHLFCPFDGPFPVYEDATSHHHCLKGTVCDSCFLSVSMV